MSGSFRETGRHRGVIDDAHLFGIQVGESTGREGLAQMHYITGLQLRAFLSARMGTIWNFLGNLGELPEDPMPSDVFYCTQGFFAQAVEPAWVDGKVYYTVDPLTGAFTVSDDGAFLPGVTYYNRYPAGTFFAYSAEMGWMAVNDVITGFFDLSSQYARGMKADGTPVTEGEPGWHDNALWWRDRTDERAREAVTEIGEATEDGKGEIDDYVEESVKPFIDRYVTKAYRTTIGDGREPEGGMYRYRVDHNLDTEDVLVQIWPVEFGGALPEYRIDRFDGNSLVVSFAERIEAASVDVVVTCVGVTELLTVDFSNITGIELMSIPDMQTILTEE